MYIHIETLGCKMNFLDSERLGKKLEKMGFLLSAKDPDFVIINTCTVTDTADKKSRTKAKNALKKAKKVIITGCGARVMAENWGDSTYQVCPSDADVLAFLKKFQSVPEKPISELPIIKTDRTRKFVEIQSGCDTFCAYCIIPFARGRSRSRSVEKIIIEIQELEAQGTKEVVLTGINLAAWGASHTNKASESQFSTLLSKILQQTKIPRIRISSVGAQFLDDQFFEVFSNDRICDHLHISIQSGSDEILAKMNRGHRTKEIREAAQKAKKARKDVAITCDIIVGFPGETDRNFQESIDLVRELGLAKLHVFPFSPRGGTLAEKMKDQVLEEIKKERSGILRNAGERLRNKFIEQNIGSKKEVLWEKKEIGITTNFIQVKKAGSAENVLEEVILTDKNVVW